MIRSGILLLGIGMACAVNDAKAQSATPSYSQSKYEYCDQRAREFSRYEGPVPDRYLPGGALEGAAKGAIVSGVGSALLGGDKKDRRRAAKRGLVLGTIFGAIKRGEAKKEQKRRARIYRLELDACMGQRR